MPGDAQERLATLARSQLDARPDEEAAVEENAIEEQAELRASRRARKLKGEAIIVEGKRGLDIHQVTREDLRQIATSPGPGGGHRVSLYMPLYGPGTDCQQNAVRLKNLVKEAEEQLVARGMRAADARDFLRQPREMTADPALWHQPPGGLALLLDEGPFHCLQFSDSVAEAVHVGPRFHIRPLVKAAGDNGHFWLLTLSQNRVRLFRGTRLGLTEVPVEGLPKDKHEALNYDMTSEGGQTHTSGPFIHQGLAKGKGKLAAVFHGQGGASDTHKAELERYCLLVDEALHGVLRNETAPLLVACVEYLFPIFRAANEYPHLVDRPLTGNPDLASLPELHQQAWPLVEPVLGKPRREAAERFSRLVGAGRTSVAIAEILPAARNGRVDTLFFARDGQLWGTFDRETNSVVVQGAGDLHSEDLIDAAAAETLGQGGEVYAVPADQMPAGRTVAAVYRY